MQLKRTVNTYTSKNLSARERLELLERVIQKKATVTDACRAFGVSRPTFYKWKKRYEEAGVLEKEELRTLSDKKQRRLKRSKQRTAERIENLIRRIVVGNPSLGKRRIRKALFDKGEKVGIHAVSNTLERLRLNRRELRERYSKITKKGIPLGKVMTFGERELFVKRILRGGIPVSVASQEFGISRNTIYKWLKRYQKALDEGLDVREALTDRERVVERWSNQASIEQERQIIDSVLINPSWGKYRLAKIVREKYGDAGLGIHGVYNVLKRNDLNSAEKRITWASIQQQEMPTVRPELSWLDRLRLAVQEFLPGRAPAPPPGVPTVPFPAPFGAGLQRLRRFAPYFLLSLLALTSLYQYGRLLGQTENIQQTIGFLFAGISLSMGTVFFLYSLKYYFTLAIVLSFSRDLSDKRQDSKFDIRNSRLGWLGRIFGIGPTTAVTDTPPRRASFDNTQDRQDDSAGLESLPAESSGLDPNISETKLERHPFISVHLPMFNEKRVAERLLRACTSFEYGPGTSRHPASQARYEIVVADDSTDETTKIIRDYLKDRARDRVRVSKGEGYSVTKAEVNSRIRIKHIQRATRLGFKGGALKEALKHTDKRAEFIVVFDADFVPYPDTLELFMKYFQSSAGGLKNIDPATAAAHTPPRHASFDNTQGKRDDSFDLKSVSKLSSAGRLRNYQDSNIRLLCSRKIRRRTIQRLKTNSRKRIHGKTRPSGQDRLGNKLD
jgi:transposase-like protein